MRVNVDDSKGSLTQTPARVSPSLPTNRSSHSFVDVEPPPSRRIPSARSTDNSANPYFHIFRTTTWQECHWKTDIFVPPRAHCAFDEDHCHRVLVGLTGYDTVQEPCKKILQTLASGIDSFALHVSRHNGLQGKLHSKYKGELGSYNGNLVIAALVKSILLDRFCWSIGLGVSDRPSQHRADVQTNDNKSPVRDYKPIIRITRTARTAIGVKQSLPQGPIPTEINRDKYLGLSFATWYTGQSDGFAIIANLCFASISCLCFIQDINIDRSLWDLYTQYFRINSSVYYSKLSAMINARTLETWKLWYRAVAVDPTMLLDPKFIRRDTSISARGLITFIKQRVGSIPSLVWETEKLLFRCLLDLIILWDNHTNVPEPQAIHSDVEAVFTSFLQSLIDVEDNNYHIDIPVLLGDYVQDIQSPIKPAIPDPIRASGSGFVNSQDKIVEGEQDKNGENHVKRENMSQLPVFKIEEDSIEAPPSTPAVTNVHLESSSLSLISRRPPSKRPRIESDEEDEPPECNRTEHQDLVAFMQGYDTGEFDDHIPLLALSDLPSRDECGRHLVKLWSCHVKNHSEHVWHQHTWSLQWTVGMFHYRELDTLLSTLSVCGDNRPSALDYEIHVNSTTSFEALTIKKQRKIFTCSNIHFTSAIIHEDLCIPTMLKALGVNLDRLITIQDHRSNQKCPGSFYQWLSCSTSVRLDTRVELALHHSSPASLSKIDVSTQIGLDNQAKVVYSMPPDRHVTSDGYMLPTWIRVLAGAQLWTFDRGENKPACCVLRAGDILVLRANTPFTTITLEETVILQGRFVTLFDFHRILRVHNRQNFRSHDLNHVVRQLASFIYQVQSPNFQTQILDMYYVSSDDMESFILWLVHNMRGREGCVWASRLIKSRPAMYDRIQSLIQSMRD